MAATHDGHRKRMRERFRISGLEGFSEHEVLELILFYGRARGNVNDTAHALMDVFGSLPRVLEASPEQLMLIDGIGEESATLLSLILPLFRRYSDEVNQVRSKLESRQVTLDYCRTMMAGYRREQFYVICLTADGSIICNRTGHFTFQSVKRIERLCFQHVFTFSCGNGTCQVGFAHRTITNNDHFVQRFRIRLQNYVQNIAL